MAKITSLERVSKFIYKVVIREQDFIADLNVRGDNFEATEFTFGDNNDVHIEKGTGKRMNVSFLMRRRDGRCLGTITNRVNKNFNDIFADMLEAI